MEKISRSASPAWPPAASKPFSLPSVVPKINSTAAKSEDHLITLLAKHHRLRLMHSQLLDKMWAHHFHKLRKIHQRHRARSRRRLTLQTAFSQQIL